MDISRKDGAKMNELLDKKISRRTLLKGAAGITGIALTSAFTVKAQGKATKAAMKYQDKPKGASSAAIAISLSPGRHPRPTAPVRWWMVRLAHRVGVPPIRRNPSAAVRHTVLYAYLEASFPSPFVCRNDALERLCLVKS